MTLKLQSNKKLYWSKQHGAYISLIAAWLIANILNGFNGIQVVAIIFLLKSILAEWVIFLLISIAAFCGLQQVVWSDIFPAIGALTLFLGSSIFTVKARFEKISVTPVLVYTAFSVALLLFYFSFNTFSIILSLLIILKTSGIWLFPEKFKAIPIRKIGIMEAIFQMLLIVDFYFFY